MRGLWPLPIGAAGYSEIAPAPTGAPILCRFLERSLFELCFLNLQLFTSTSIGVHAPQFTHTCKRSGCLPGSNVSSQHFLDGRKRHRTHLFYDICQFTFVFLCHFSSLVVVHIPKFALLFPRIPRIFFA